MDVKSLINRIPESAKKAFLVVLVAKILVLSIGYIVTWINLGLVCPLDVLGNLFYRWDASNYVTIAQNGYVNTGNDANFIVFFPFYPLLIRLFTFSFDYASISALAIANVASLVAFFYLYKLSKLEFNEGAALKAVLFLSVFPTAYFLSAPYTEGLFFALIISCFYYARIGRWELAGLLSLLASLTRLAGLLLLPALIIEYYHQKRWRLCKTKKDFIFVFSALTGFFIYLLINIFVTGNPFSFMEIEATHWHNTLDPLTGLNRAWYWTLNGEPIDSLTLGAAPIMFSVFGLFMIGVAFWKHLRPSYLMYMILAWGLAVSTSWWISAPRYIMAMFPMFMLIGVSVNKKVLNCIFVTFMLGWLCFFTVLFALGWWAF